MYNKQCDTSFLNTRTIAFKIKSLPRAMLEIYDRANKKKHCVDKDLTTTERNEMALPIKKMAETRNTKKKQITHKNKRQQTNNRMYVLPRALTRTLTADNSSLMFQGHISNEDELCPGLWRCSMQKSNLSFVSACLLACNGEPKFNVNRSKSPGFMR